jgi:hypothetical protein
VSAAPAPNPAAAPELRAAFIVGLLDLACFLEAHPDVPVQRFGETITLHTGHELPHDGTWDDELRALKEFARTIGADVTVSPGGHYYAGRSFGPIRYEGCAISPAAHARHDARNSYADVISLDDAATAA